MWPEVEAIVTRTSSKSKKKADAAKIVSRASPREAEHTQALDVRKIVSTWAWKTAPSLMAVYAVVFRVLGKVPFFALNALLSSGLILLLFFTTNPEAIGEMIGDSIGAFPAWGISWFKALFAGMRHSRTPACPPCPTCSHQTFVPQEHQDSNGGPLPTHSEHASGQPPASPPFDQLYSPVIACITTLMTSKWMGAGTAGAH